MRKFFGYTALVFGLVSLVANIASMMTGRQAFPEPGTLEFGAQAIGRAIGVLLPFFIAYLLLIRDSKGILTKSKE